MGPLAAIHVERDQRHPEAALATGRWDQRVVIDRGDDVRRAKAPAAVVRAVQLGDGNVDHVAHAAVGMHAQHL